MKEKNFKMENPALAFISDTDPDEEEQEPEAKARSKETPEGYKPNPEYVEVKSRRVQLLLQPSVVEALKALAEERGQSMNEAANIAIKEYLKGEGKL